MNFDFSDDQKFLKDQARKFLNDTCTSAEVRAVLNDPKQDHSAKVWQGVIDMGWLGTTIPEEYGGLGLGQLEMCVIAEEMGRVLAPVPFSSTVYMLAEAVKLFGNLDQKAAILPKIAAGELIGCYAASEGPGAVDAAHIKAQVSGGKLTGTKVPVLDGAIADMALVLAREGQAVSAFLVVLDQPGVTRTSITTLEPTRGHAEIRFDGATVERLGAAGEGLSIAEAMLNHAAVLLAFEQLGGADRCLELATAFAKERFAFGQPIGVNQAIKHKLADMYVANQVARSNAYFGAWALSTGAAELAEAAAAARVACTNAYWLASKENIQTHGGMGFTWEVDAHLFFRRAKLLSVQAGGLKVWKEKLVKALELKNAA
jgi:alkylation response protein AidB-like acyl-CoA dehydrogenase